MASFTDRLAAGEILLADGATGTNYQNMSIEPGMAPEEWVIDAPERVIELHRQFAQAGADLVLTCSFGASAPRLLDGPLVGRMGEVNRRAAELAAIGANCGRSLQDNAAVVAEFLANTSRPLWVKPNAGVPRITGADVVYDVEPEALGAQLQAFVQQGARIVGGCCGSTPAHIAATSRALGP
jgi:5-methyltetrahydrofolate--homocysteine methyltransferase